MHKSSLGMTLVEVVMVLVIIALVCSAAVPRYVEKSALNAAQNRQLAGESVKSAMTRALSGESVFPTVSQLASHVQAKQTRARANAIVVLRNGREYSVATFRDSACRTPTTALTDRVQCVGGIL